MIKKFNQIAIDKGKFFSAVAFDDIDGIDDVAGNTVDIEMLRIGIFMHKKYGELDITDEMLETMVTNFKNNIVGREVSFDWNHKAEAASGWLKNVRIEDGVLIGTTELTDEGKDSIKKKKYGYFSIEYSDDYENPETGEKHGPTIVGGALTNRPFMTKLKKIEFSLEDLGVSIYRLQEDESMDDPTKVKRTPVKKTDDGDDDLQTKLETANSEIDNLKKKLEESEKKLEEVSGDSGDDKKLQEFITEQKKAMTTLQNEIKTLREQGDDDRKKLVDSEEKNRQLSVSRTCEKLIRDDHHHPAIIEVAKQIMMSDSSGKKIVKLSETVGEGDDEKTVELEMSLTEAIMKVLEAIPKSQRADYDEKTSTDSEVSLTNEEEAKLESEAINKAMTKKGLKRVK
jgi:hypothetical protein